MTCFRLTPKKTRSPEDSERGAAIVEFVLVLPLFVALVMGIVDFGLNLTNISAARQATREGARRAAVGDPSQSECQLVGPTATQMTSDAGHLLCSVKRSASTIGSNLRVKLVFPTTYEAGHEALVCSAYEVQSVTGFFRPLLAGRYTKIMTQMRVERVEVDLTALAETPFAGQDWSWCE